MLETLTHDDFTSRVTERFTLTGGGQALELTLIEAKALGPGLRAGGAFSLLFQGPAEPAAQQGTYALENAQMGKLELFLVPVGPRGETLLYEAVFA